MPVDDVTLMLSPLEPTSCQLTQNEVNLFWEGKVRRVLFSTAISDEVEEPER